MVKILFSFKKNIRKFLIFFIDIDNFIKIVIFITGKYKNKN